MGEYVISLQADESLVKVELDPATGSLREVDRTGVPGGPAPLVPSSSSGVIYAGLRNEPGISAVSADTLDVFDTVALESDPCFLGMDRTGTYLFATYYRAGMVTVHRINGDATLQSEPVQVIKTHKNAHSIWIDPENRFAFVPHTGPNKILQFLFDGETGLLSPNGKPEADVPDGVEPRHLAMTADGRYFYCANEKASSVTTYVFDSGSGTLTAAGTTSTLPQGYSGSNSCSQIRLSPDESCLYVANRGHDSIAIFRIDPASRQPEPIAHAETEPNPRALCMSSDGRFFMAAGLGTSVVAVYAVAHGTGNLERLSGFGAGKQPMWIQEIR